MRLTAFLAAMVLIVPHASASQGKASAQGPNEQFATAQAMRLVPMGATITGSECRSIDVGFDSRYICTLTYDRQNQE